MDFGKEGPLSRFKWYLVVIYVALIALVLLSFFTDIFRTSVPGQVPQFVWLGGALIFLVTLIIILAKAINILSAIEQNQTKLDKIANTLEKNTDLFSQIAQSTRLSETAKAIAFRDADRQSLREAVFDKLQQQDFETTYAIIDEIAHSTIYHKLAQELRVEADKYRDATDAERENQVIAHIEKLF